MALRLTETQFARMQRGLPIGQARKYLNVPTSADGILFQSALEARHYRVLALRQKAGEIRDLRWQVEIPLAIDGVKIGTYRADFTYEERDVQRGVLPGCEGTTWVPRVVDTKSPRTRLTAAYRLKKRILQVLGTEIVEVLPPPREGRRRRPRRRR